MVTQILDKAPPLKLASRRIFSLEAVLLIKITKNSMQKVGIYWNRCLTLVSYLNKIKEEK